MDVAPSSSLPQHLGRERDESLDAILRPRSIAVIGAGRDADSVPGRLFQNLRASFAGPLYAVNPHAQTVQSVRAYASVLEVPGSIDLAFIVVPAASVLGVVGQCARKGVRGLVVISAGFSEIGQENKQQELVELVHAAGMRMIGPNCVGVAGAHPAFNGTFAPCAAPPGNIAVCSQSGALGVLIPDYLRRSQLGISAFVSVGNKADVGENDLLRYWQHDPTSQAIVLYLESFQEPREFLRTAREVSRRKPIVALKAGRSLAGARAAGSHTAALYSPEAATTALFHQAGVVRAETLEELFDIAALLSRQPVPRGPRVAVLTNAGGPAVLCADALESAGLAVPELSADLQAELRQQLPIEASVRNPVDLIASMDIEQYRHCLRLLLAADEVDSIVVMFVPRRGGVAATLSEAIREEAATMQQPKTLLGVFMEPSEICDESRCGWAAVPVFSSPESAARALAAAARYGRWLRRPMGVVPSLDGFDRDVARGALNDALRRMGGAGGWLTPSETHRVLAAFGLPLPQWEIARSAEEAAVAAGRIGGPVAVKAISPTAIHKSDRGGVLLNVQGDQAARDAFRRVTEAVADATGTLIQEFVPNGQEVLIGVTRDPAFGHLIAFGLGGVLVELLGDVSFRLSPLTNNDADEMIRGIKTARLLEGYRGQQPADVEALEQMLLRVSALVEALPEIVEMDLNPVKALPPGQGVRVVDARIRLG